MSTSVIRIQLPAHLRTLVRLPGYEVHLPVELLTIRGVLDALEAEYPVLRGTIRDQITHERRPFLRFFACQEDLSQLGPDTALPEGVIAGAEPLIILGAVAGG